MNIQKIDFNTKTEKVIITVPAALIEAIRNYNPNKPYDICLWCSFLSKTCDGPDFTAMEYHRWVEWINKRMKDLGITRAQLAERANIPLSTLNSILSGRTNDIKVSTMREITRAVVGGCWGQYPCHLAALLMNSEELRVDEQILELQRQLEEEKNKNADLRMQLNSYHESHQKELATVREEAQKKTDWLKSRCTVMDGYINDQKALVAVKEASIARKEKTIAALCVIIALLGAFIIGSLVYDKLHPDRGWIQSENMSYYLPMETANEQLYQKDQKV